jgi:hypothetical protein
MSIKFTKDILNIYHSTRGCEVPEIELIYIMNIAISRIIQSIKTNLKDLAPDLP